MGRVKQVILIRKDLSMRRGKEIAQGSHASMEFVMSQLRKGIETKDSAEEVYVRLQPIEREWIMNGMAKVCLRVNSEEELLEYHKKAIASGLKSHLIRDSGRTEFHGQPTLTACAIGPDDSEKIDSVTGQLVLY